MSDSYWNAKTNASAGTFSMAHIDQFMEEERKKASGELVQEVTLLGNLACYEYAKENAHLFNDRWQPKGVEGMKAFLKIVRLGGYFYTRWVPREDANAQKDSG